MWGYFALKNMKTTPVKAGRGVEEAIYENMNGAAVSLFDKTGNMVRPWAEAGYDCYCFDIQHKGIKSARVGTGTITFIQWNAIGADALLLAGFERNDVGFVSAFPPCTHLAVSGARWFKGKGLRALAQSIEMFAAAAAEICEALGAPYLIENPVSTISTYWRKPDFNFHPWHYTAFEPDDNYTKQTCLWTGNGFVMPERNVLDGLPKPDNRIHAAPPSDERADFRSATPMGFARAVFQANAYAGADLV